jgi:hypothetical protein
MSALVEEQPGFLEKKTFAAVDGERVTLAEFDARAHRRCLRRASLRSRLTQSKYSQR